MIKYAFCVVIALLISSLNPTRAISQENAKRTVDPSGTWRWEYDLQGTQYKDLVRLKIGDAIKDSKDLMVKGKYESTSGRKIEIQNGRISGDTVTFDFKIDYQGTDVKLEFEGKVKNDNLTGKVKASTNDGTRDLDWTATRNVLADDVVGKWKLKIDANGNIMEPILSVSKDGEKLKANYVLGSNAQIEAKDVRIEKNTLSFTIETDFQGSKIKADFMGRPYGDAIRGSIDYVLGSDAGEIDFDGQRQDGSN